MRVRLNEFGRQWAEVEEPVLAAVRQVGASGWYILGEEVAAFEHALAKAWGAGEVVGVGSGLDGLEIALRCLDVAPGDRVVTTPLSAFATTLALLRVGAVPVFVDTDAAGLLDLDRCADLLRRDRGVRGILPVHLYGQSLDLDALAALQAGSGVWVVEDCAQALGASWRQRPVGTVGALAATSFYPTKNLGALGDGGAVATAVPGHARAARALRHYGQTATYRHEYVGLNSRLDELHAAVLRQALLPRLPEFVAARRRTAERYLAEITNPRVVLPRPPAPGESAWHLFPARIPGGRRPELARHLAERGIETAVHYPSLIPDQPAMRGRRFETAGGLDHARAFAAEEVSLPVHPFLRPEEVDHVIGCCNAWGS